jgi:hypothetical protein
MSSDIGSRSEEEKQRHRERFNHHRYQLKRSTKGGGGYQFCLNKQIDQVPGAYAFPRTDAFIKTPPPPKPPVDDITPEDLDDC